MTKRGTERSQKTRQLVQIALMLGLALALSYIERLIPLNLGIPGMKLGLANLVILTGLYILPLPAALTLVMLKCFMTAWMFGSFSAFLYSVSGSLLSFAVMALFFYLSRKQAPVLVTSMLGAVFHNIGQLIMAAFILQNTKVWYYFPVLFVAGLLTGLLIGVCSRSILPYVLNRV